MRRLLTIFTSIVMMLSMWTLTVFAATVPNNSGTLAELAAGDYMDVNNGTITTNNGSLRLNQNRVVENNGKIENNSKTIVRNYGNVSVNFTGGTINTNYGTVETNYASVTNASTGIININYADMISAYGTINDNRAEIRLNDKAHVVTNNKTVKTSNIKNEVWTVDYNNGNVNADYGTLNMIENNKEVSTYNAKVYIKKNSNKLNAYYNENQSVGGEWVNIEENTGEAEIQSGGYIANNSGKVRAGSFPVYVKNNTGNILSSNVYVAFEIDNPSNKFFSYDKGFADYNEQKWINKVAKFTVADNACVSIEGADVYQNDNTYYIENITGTVKVTIFEEHNFGEWEKTAEATCTEKEKYERSCDNCGIKEMKETAALGHDWGPYEMYNEPSCTTEGSKVSTCNRCGKDRYISVPMKEHQWAGEYVEIYPTCYRTGSKYKICEMCGERGMDSPIPALEHKYSSWYTMRQATEVSNGEMRRSCSLCGNIQYQITEQLAPTLPSVKISKPKSAKGYVTVKWKKPSKKNLKKIGGIEMQIAVDPDFTNIVKSTTAGSKKTSKKISGLQSKTKYWVRIRAYKNAADGKHVSVWKVKKVKTK